jgi:hypothetical protein
VALVIVYTIAALYGMSIPLNIALIGKPRKPVTHGVAVFAVLTAFSAIVGLSYVASQL